MLLHTVLWGLVLLFFTQFLKFQTEDLDKIIHFSLLLMPVTIFTTYTTIYYLIPKYLLLKHYWTFLLYSIYLIILSAYFITLSIYGGLIFLSRLKIEEMLPISKSLLLVFVGVFTIVFIASVFSLERQNRLKSRKG
ncbi:MAG: histidine kinase, partial [Aureispira sp.]